MRSSGSGWGCVGPRHRHELSSRVVFRQELERRVVDGWRGRGWIKDDVVLLRRVGRGEEGWLGLDHELLAGTSVGGFMSGEDQSWKAW